jgi:hypothetical protein
MQLEVATVLWRLSLTFIECSAEGLSGGGGRMYIFLRRKRVLDPPHCRRFWLVMSPVEHMMAKARNLRSREVRRCLGVFLWRTSDIGARSPEGHEPVLPRVAEVLDAFPEQLLEPVLSSTEGIATGKTQQSTHYRQQSMRLSKRYKFVYCVEWVCATSSLRLMRARVE